MEIIPKPPEKIPILEKIFFGFSFLLFILVVIFFGYLLYFTRELQSQKTDIEERIEALKTPEVERKEEELRFLEKQISAFKEKIETFTLASKFFPFLEEKILKSVLLTSIEIDLLNEKAFISAQASDFETLIKQYRIFKENEGKISDLKIESISFQPEGKLKFSLSFSFDKEILR